VRVKENDVREEFEHGQCGLCWNARSDAVEWLMRGYDRKLRSIIEERFSTAVRAYQAEMNGAVLRILEDVLNSMPDGVDTSLPSSVLVAAPWDSINVNVPYAALPLQEAIHFVSYLIMMQAGKSRFAPGGCDGGRSYSHRNNHEG
jgi:hypothetical protein